MPCLIQKLCPASCSTRLPTRSRARLLPRPADPADGHGPRARGRTDYLSLMEVRVGRGKFNAGSVDILLVEDNEGDVRLTREALKEGKVSNNLSVVNDGVEALRMLRKEGPYKDARTPDLILLDLNLPRKDGRQVLQEIKSDPNLKRIPVVVLTTSSAEEDILRS